MNCAFFKKIIFSLFFFTAANFIFSQKLDLGRIITYIDAPVVEQRQIIDKDEIEKSHAENLVSILQDKGIQILSYGPYGLESKPQIRGFTDETVRVVIDGICVNNAQYGTFDFSTISLESIEKIEIVRGGFTEGISDEGSVAGTIYITTNKQNPGHKLTSDSQIKTYLNKNYPLDTFSQNIYYNGQVAENSFIKSNVHGTYAENKFIFKSYNNKLLERQNADVIDGSADFQYTQFFGNGNSFSIGENFYAGNKNCPGPENSTNPGLQKDYDNRLTFNITNPAIKNALSLENNLAYLTNIRFYDDNLENSKHFVNTVSYSIYARLYKFKNIKESAGLSFDAVFLDSTNDGNHIQISGALKSTTKITFNSSYGMTVPLSCKFCGKNFAFIPKLGFYADYKFLDLKLNGYRMVQFPNMDDLYWIGSGYHGNPDLLPETGWGGEFTFNLKTKILPFSLCVFTNYYENKIQWSGTSPKNIASAFYAGADFSTAQNFLDEKICLKFNGEYLYTRLMDKSNKMTYGKKIMWTPDFTFSASADFNFKKLGFNINGNYVGKRYKSNLNASYLKPYFLLNAGIEYPDFKNFVPYLKLDNILNWDYEAADSYPMPGFSMSVGLRTKWQFKK